jgi:SAM-dependent methyltransferase
MESTDSRTHPEPSPASSVERGRELFDEQAAMFDQRAGLPDVYCPAIARSVLEIAEVRPGELVVEVGPGTGQIGRWLDASARYVGLDLSAGMLREFKESAGERDIHGLIMQADANAIWPLAGGTARAVFSSRAAHLLNQEHVVAEVLRVASPAGASVIIGRVERAAESVRARMAREMNERLRRHGLEGRRGEQRKRRLFDSLKERGAEILEPVTVARWKVSSSPRQSLDSWRSHAGLGGRRVAPDIREEILNGLEAWAVEVFGGLDARLDSEEAYVLSALRVPATRPA